jgi:transposase
MKKYYVGMDVHKATIAIAVLDAYGKLITQSVIETSTQAVRDFFQTLRGEVHVTFEEGNHAAWLFDVVEPLVGKVVVCNPKHNKKQMGRHRNDRVDAKQLAELLRLNAVKGVYHGEHGTRTLKHLMRSYECFASDITRVKNRLKAIYNSQAIFNRRQDLYHTSKRQSWLEQLRNPGQRIRAELLFLQLEELKKHKRAAKKAMIVESKRHEAEKVLSQIPELGPVRVAQLIATIDTPFRFRTKRPFWKYLGFAVETASSSDHELVEGRVRRKKKQVVQTRGLNEDYNRRLKSLFKSAATHACGCGAYKEYYEGLLRTGMRPEMARLAVARRLAATVLAVWKSGESFDEGRILSRAA